MNMLLYMSLSGAVLIGFILLLRATVSAYLPRRLFVLLWDLALARLLLPVMIPASFGMNALLPLQAAGSAAEGTSVLPPWVLVWMAGTAVTAAVMIFLYIREWHVLREALPAEAEAEKILRAYLPGERRLRILISDQITTPVLCGIVQPRIILPKSFVNWDDEALKCALTHEAVHAHTLDNLQKLFAMAAVCMHWFNPLVWVMQIMLDRDLEKACDETVIRRLGEEHRWDYAQTLLDLAAARKLWSVCGNGFGRSAVRERIHAMMTHRSTGAAAAAAAAGIVLTSMTAFAGAVPAPTVEADTFPSADVLVWEVDMDSGLIERDGTIVGSLNIPEGIIPNAADITVVGTDVTGAEIRAFGNTVPDVWYWIEDT